MQFKSIRTKLSIVFAVLILFICSGLGFISYLYSEGALMDNINESLSNLSKEASKVVQERVDSKLNALEVLAESDLIKGEELNINEKLQVLKSETQRGNHLWMAIVDVDGNVITTDGDTENVADLEYFQKAKSGSRAVSDPYRSKITNDLVVAYAVSIKDSDKVKGVLVSIRDGYELSALTNDIHIGKNGEAFMINNNGTTVAHKDKNLVMQMDNDFENVKKDAQLESLVELEKQMVAGKEGVGEYTYNDVTKYMGYAPVDGTNWSLALTAPRSEVMAKVNSLLKTVLIASIIILVVGIVITYLIALNISKPSNSLLILFNIFSSSVTSLAIRSASITTMPLSLI
jgi:methyl-accepting chemotaxis protein